MASRTLRRPKQSIGQQHVEGRGAEGAKAFSRGRRLFGMVRCEPIHQQRGALDATRVTDEAQRCSAHRGIGIVHQREHLGC